MSGVRRESGLGALSGRETNRRGGKPGSGRLAKKPLQSRADQCSLTLLAKPSAERDRTQIRWLAAPITGVRSWMVLAELTFTATMAWRLVISTMTDSMISTSASPRDFQTGFIATAETEPSKT